MIGTDDKAALLTLVSLVGVETHLKMNEVIKMFVIM